MYDVANKESFDNVRTWIGDVEQYTSRDVAKMIVGNKCELRNCFQVRWLLEDGVHFFERKGAFGLAGFSMEGSREAGHWEKLCKSLLDWEVHCGDWSN